MEKLSPVPKEVSSLLVIIPVRERSVWECAMFLTPKQFLYKRTKMTKKLKGCYTPGLCGLCFIKNHF